MERTMIGGRSSLTFGVIVYTESSNPKRLKIVGHSKYSLGINLCECAMPAWNLGKEAKGILLPLPS